MVKLQEILGDDEMGTNMSFKWALAALFFMVVYASAGVGQAAELQGQVAGGGFWEASSNGWFSRNKDWLLLFLGGLLATLGGLTAQGAQAYLQRKENNRLFEKRRDSLATALALEISSSLSLLKGQFENTDHVEVRNTVLMCEPTLHRYDQLSVEMLMLTGEQQIAISTFYSGLKQCIFTARQVQKYPGKALENVIGCGQLTLSLLKPTT